MSTPTNEPATRCKESDDPEGVDRCLEPAFHFFIHGNSTDMRFVCTTHATRLKKAMDRRGLRYRLYVMTMTDKRIARRDTVKQPPR
jgi:hypothetical protein